MNEQTREPEEQFVKKAVTRSAIEVDCSKWVDTAAGGWTFGSFATASDTREAVAVDCSHWEREPAAWLELVVSFEGNTPPAQVWEHTKRLIVEVSRAAPELGLAYDVNHSRTENEDVVIALTPRSSPGAAQRLNQLADVIRRATEISSARRGVVVRIVGKAA
jgi:hypothetical protein